jgi:hypothetical protein
MKFRRLSVLFAVLAGAQAATLFTTGAPDGAVGVVSGGVLNFPGTVFSAADDFILFNESLISGGTFTGLITPPLRYTDIVDVSLSIYNVTASTATGQPVFVPDGLAAYANSTSGQLTYAQENSSANTAERTFPRASQPVPFFGFGTTFNFVLESPIVLPAGHYFVSPRVVVTSVPGGPPQPGLFYWLSAPWPVGTSATDYGAVLIGGGDAGPSFWVPVSNAAGGPENMSFSLRGEEIPEPAAAWLILAGLAALAYKAARSRFAA